MFYSIFQEIKLKFGSQLEFDHVLINRRLNRPPNVPKSSRFLGPSYELFTICRKWFNENG